MSTRKMPATLDLVRGEVLLGRIDVKPGRGDFPWSSGVFHPTPEFGVVRDLFAHELALLRANESDDSAQWDDWEAVYDKLVEPGLKLRTADGGYEEGDLLIHIEGTEAWWRNE